MRSLEADEVLNYPELALQNRVGSLNHVHLAEHTMPRNRQPKHHHVRKKNEQEGVKILVTPFRYFVPGRLTVNDTTAINITKKIPSRPDLDLAAKLFVRPHVREPKAPLDPGTKQNHNLRSSTAPLVPILYSPIFMPSLGGGFHPAAAVERLNKGRKTPDN